jgi:hypothetical protein
MRSFTLPALAVILSASPALAGKEEFLGQWIVTEALVAPWQDPANPASNAVEAAYVGKTITIGESTIEGPERLGCGKTEFIAASIPFAGMFEGGLASDPAEPGGAPSLERAQANAAALGYKSEPVSSLATGCSEVLLYLRDQDTIEFGLDNRIFVMKRKP